MGVGQVSVAAATAVVGYDLARDTTWQSSGRRRALSGLGLCGSAAGGDTKISLYIDTVRVGEFYNITTGLPTNDHIIVLDNYFVPPFATIHAIVDDAPATNPINLTLKWADF